MLPRNPHALEIHALVALIKTSRVASLPTLIKSTLIHTYPFSGQNPQTDRFKLVEQKQRVLTGNSYLCPFFEQQQNTENLRDGGGGWGRAGVPAFNNREKRLPDTLITLPLV